MDGQFHAIEFDPSATADEVLKLVKAKIGLRENAQGENNSHVYISVVIMNLCYRNNITHQC